MRRHFNSSAIHFHATTDESKHSLVAVYSFVKLVPKGIETHLNWECITLESSGLIRKGVLFASLLRLSNVTMATV